MVVCLERGADLHMAQLMPLPLTVSCFSKIHIGFIFLVPAHPGSTGKTAVKRACVSHTYTQVHAGADPVEVAGPDPDKISVVIQKQRKDPDAESNNVAPNKKFK